MLLLRLVERLRRAVAIEYGVPLDLLSPRQAFVSRCPWGNCSQRSSRGTYSDDICYAMGAHELPGFVNMTVVFER